MDHLHGLEYRPTAFRLEWMDEAPHDLAESSAFLASLVREVHPDCFSSTSSATATFPSMSPA